MLIFIRHVGDKLEIRARMEGDGMLGDFRETVSPGDTIFGKPASELFALPDGQHELFGEPDAESVPGTIGGRG